MLSRTRLFWTTACITLPIAIASYCHEALAQANPEAIAPPAVTTVLPETIGGVLLLNTTEAAWDAFDQFQLFRLVEQEINIAPGLGSLLFLPPSLNYEEEVLPWIGDRAAIVIMPATADSALVRDQLLTLAPIARPEAFTNFIEAIQSSRAEPPTETVYNGTTIQTWQGTEPAVSQETTPLTTPKKGTLLPSPLPTQVKPGSKVLGSLDPEIMDLPEIGSEGEASEAIAQPGLAVAVLPGFVALAETPGPIQQLIDAQASVPSLAASADFQRTLADPNFERSLVIGYGNLEAIARFEGLGVSAPDVSAAPVPLPVPAPAPLPPADALLLPLQTLSVTADAIETFIYLQPEGLRAQSRLRLRQPAIALAQLDAIDTIYDQIPAPTYLLASGQDFRRQWQQISAGLQATPATANGLDQARMFFQTITGLNLDEDLISWMDGEYAFFLFPSEQNAFDLVFPRLDMGVGLMIQTSDRAAAEAALQQLDTQVSALNFSAIAHQVNEQPIVSWEPGLAAGDRNVSLLTHAWVDDQTLVLTTGIEPMGRLNPAPLDALSESYTFQSATQSFPQPNRGYFYVNLGSTLALIYGLLPPDWKTGNFRDIQRFLGTFRSLSGTLSSTEKTIQFDFLLGFAPAPSRTATDNDSEMHLLKP